MVNPVRMGVIGIDHRHIYTMTQHMLDVGNVLVGWWTQGAPDTQAGFIKRFPDATRVADPDILLNDPTIDLILVAGVPDERAGHAIRAMTAGKDVLSDKPGCVSGEQLAQLRKVQAETGQIWSIDFSERFEVEAVTCAADLVAEGAIGQVVQTVGLGPHRLNRATRPDWFFQRARYGGVLVDIASHQIDQFLYFTGSDTARISTASVGNFANPNDPELQDFGQLVLESPTAHGYIRVDWYTPDGLPTWGDGRLFLLGTEGTIELRKYVDIDGHAGTDHVLLVNNDRCEHIHASGCGYPFFQRLTNDVRDRTETAMSQAHCFKVMELAIEAQSMAEAGR
jgi:predicted dehydrogenase